MHFCLIYRENLSFQFKKKLRADLYEEDGENLAKVTSNVDEQGEGTGICRTAPWSEWAPCSASCGIGITMRTRTFLDHQGRKKCPHILVGK